MTFCYLFNFSSSAKWNNGVGFISDELFSQTTQDVVRARRGGGGKKKINIFLQNAKRESVLFMSPTYPADPSCVLSDRLKRADIDILSIVYASETCGKDTRTRRTESSAMREPCSGHLVEEKETMKRAKGCFERAPRKPGLNFLAYPAHHLQEPSRLSDTTWTWE